MDGRRIVAVLVFKLPVLGLGLALWALNGWGCGNGQQEAAPAPTVLARVDSVQITAADFDRALASLEGGVPIEGKSLEEWRAQLQLLIDEKLLVLEAQKRGLDRTPEVVTALRLWERKRLVDSLLATEMGDQLEWDEAELARYFATRQGQREIRVSRLVLESRDKALEALKKARQGTALTELSAEYSAAQAPYRQGDLGWINALATQDPRVASLFVLEKGAVELIEADGIYFVLALTEERQVNLEERRQLATKALQSEKRNAANFAYLEHLAQKYEVGLDTVVVQTLAEAKQIPGSRRLLSSRLGAWSVAEYRKALEELSPGQPPAAQSVSELAFAITRTYIVDQLLVREAQAKGLYAAIGEALAKVRNQKMVEALWERQGLSKVQVSDTEVKLFYEKNISQYQGAPFGDQVKNKIRRDLREQKAVPLFEAYLNDLRVKYQTIVAVEEEAFGEFVAAKRQSELPVGD